MVSSKKGPDNEPASKLFLSIYGPGNEDPAPERGPGFMSPQTILTGQPF